MKNYFLLLLSLSVLCVISITSHAQDDMSPEELSAIKQSVKSILDKDTDKDTGAQKPATESTNPESKPEAEAETESKSKPEAAANPTPEEKSTATATTVTKTKTTEKSSIVRIEPQPLRKIETEELPAPVTNEKAEAEGEVQADGASATKTEPKTETETETETDKTSAPEQSTEIKAEEPAVKSNAKYAVALHGTPKYPPDFTHVDFVNPDAPKGGTLKQHEIGTFDSLNPFIIKGTPAAGLNALRTGFVFESLMQNAWDEPFTLYGILAQGIEIADDKSWVAFDLRPEAKFADGTPVTADDVVWTFNTLRDKGSPFYSAYWHDVKSVTAESPSRVKFEFSVKGNAELPLIIAEMVVLPKHFWDGKTFEESTLEKPLGSGAYIIDKVEPGKKITYTRNKNWWGKDLPFFKGMNNFNTLEFDYYRDSNVALEAFFAGEYDVRIENTAKLWEQGYNAPAVKNGTITKEEIKNNRPAGMQAFVYNIRRPVFADKVVREALAYAFDFEWSNEQFAFGDYIRTDSYFENSELASGDLPQGDELKILEAFKGKLPETVFTKEYIPPMTDGSGNVRSNLKKASDMLDAAGYVLGKDGIRAKNGVHLEFEIIDANPQFERWVLPFLQNLKRIGVSASFRVVDTAQYQNRMTKFDYDMTISSFGQSDSPGNEQRDFWSSEKADIHGSRNYIGIKDPVVDALIDQIIHAGSREDLVTKTRALDRVLLHGHYVIPMWHYPKWRIAYWNKLKRPEKLSPLSPLIGDTWWINK